MDWEALSELQQQLLDQPAVILVSPAPIFGVKVIEAVQRVFTFFGQPLLVDAENWMAHPGSAHVLLNIFRHSRTPPQFMILSGDVHYSFVYDICLRFQRNSPRILQITTSGLKNTFPKRLLRLFDYLDQAFYGQHSPFNWLTKRRRMRIHRRRPQHSPRHTLVNHSGLGDVILAEKLENSQPLIHCDKQQTVSFVRPSES